MLDTRVRDWSTDSGAAGGRSASSLLRSIAGFILGAAILWLLLFAAQARLPYVRNGAAAVTRVKQDFAASAMFGPDERVRTVSFGNSKVLAGFRPATFEAALGPGTRSYNLAIPEDDRFVDLLENTLAHGNRPTHVLIQGFPHTPPPDSLWTTLRDNKKLAALLFPFRDFVRDSFIFVFEAHAAGGIGRQYRSNAAQVARLRSDRGYYFIKSQSHYPGDRLPDDYRLPTDRPDFVMRPMADTADPEFQRLMRLADRYDFQVIVVPTVSRRGEMALPPDTDDALTAALRAYPRVHVLGPAYWLYAPREFSDPVHLNPGGAERYTRQLADLVRGALEPGR